MMNYKVVHQLIKKSRSVLISAHVSPDLDALCSELAMAQYLRSLGKRVHIINSEKVPEMYQFVKGSSCIKTPGKRAVPYDVALVFDCGELRRIGKAQQVLDLKKPIVNFDHHVTNTFFGQYNLVKPKASSTAEVLFDFFYALKIPLNKTIAELLYLGILTDTGSFRYENTTSHTHRIAAQLVDFGLSANKLYQKVYTRFSPEDLGFSLKVASNFELLFQKKVVCFSLSKKTTDYAGDRFDIRDHLFTTFRTMRGVEVIVIFTQIGSRLTKVNFRSNGRVNVAEVAGFFGGGGHKAASGCQVRGNAKDVKQKVLKILNKHL
ncbi:MAG: bifunctional oligoribonuclease/PAP phosphatase NrnA [Candidatus Aceula meridiana]|nr:bifunctional oligoribonuclease/PAP phosphatase NrnA [Candidatus Aceula meridiana]